MQHLTRLQERFGLNVAPDRGTGFFEKSAASLIGSGVKSTLELTGPRQPELDVPSFYLGVAPQELS